MNHPSTLDVIGIHDALMRRDGRLPTPCIDPNKLEAALMCPLQLALYEGETDLAILAARYATAIILAHGFEDYNKRTATFTADVFLRLNGHRLVLSDSDAKALAALVERYAAATEQITADERHAANTRRLQDERELAASFRTHLTALTS